jgi:tRNA A58 N-methylase Trm61
MKQKLANTFCKCIKKVRKTMKTLRSRKAKEQRAIAICVRSVLQKKRGVTLKNFKCMPKPEIYTQHI